MNILNNPDLLDRLAASYALGTLRGGARRRFESLCRQSPTARTAALIWSERLAGMTELQTRQVPSDNVWKRIQIELDAQAQPRVAAQAPEESPMFKQLRKALGLWRGAAMAGAFASAAAVLVGVGLNRELDTAGTQLSQANQQRAQLVAQLQTAPKIEYVAVLADDKANASVLVTFDPHNRRLVLKRVGGYQEASDRSLQLWALPPGGGAKSLGVMGSDPVVRLTALEGQVRDVPTLAISLEPKGGVPGEGGPTGPVLFKGALLQAPV